MSPQLVDRGHRPFHRASAVRSAQWVGRRLAALGWRLAPPTCLLCGSPAETEGLDLCRLCEAALPASGSGLELAPAPLQALFAPWTYQWPIDRLVRSIKFRGDRCPARVLGTLLALRRARLPAPLPELLVPVPLHASRLRQRGFNQADELARHAARVLHRPRAPGLLQRVRASAPQSLSGGSERRRRLRGAFRCTRPLAGCTLALIDDVVTTGSTAIAAAEALRDAGARAIELWVVGDAR